MDERVYVAIVQHKQGNNVYVSKSHSGVINQVYEYVIDWWYDYNDSDSFIPEGKQTAVDQYFKNAEGFEWMTIDRMEVKD